MLDAAARLGNWSQPGPAGRARGIAFSQDFGSHTAQVAEVSRVNGKIVVDCIAVAIDGGFAVNPDEVVAQVQVSVVQALANTFWAEITFAKGRVNQRNFNQYRPIRLRETPDIVVTILQGDTRPGGVGEPGVRATAPAIANA